MSNRFETLFALSNNLYSESSPVIVSAGVLLKDTESNRLAAQLKFRNVSNKTIRALTVSLTCVDTAGHPLGEPISYQYMDLTASRSEEFGGKKAILIPDAKTRGFHITEITAVYSDGTTQAVPVQLAPLPKQEPLPIALDDPQMVKQYRLATNDNAQYVPQSTNGLQLCPCGQWHTQPYCAECGLSFEQARERYSIPDLKEAMELRLEQEAADREEQCRDEKYSKAAEDLASGKLRRLHDAESAFTSLGDYRDSAALVLQCRDAIKGIALEKMQNPKSPYDYAEAEKIFRSLGDMDDCKALAERCHAKFTTSKDHQTDKLKKLVKRVIIAVIIVALVAVMVPVAKTHIIPAIKYSQAEKLIESAQYDEAIAAFEALGEYKDASVRITDAHYSKALSLMESGAYMDAARIFDELNDYLDSHDKLTECIYLDARALMDTEEYEDAVQQLNKLDGYEDTEELLDLCYLALAERNYDEGHYAHALAWYTKITDLDTENTVYMDCVYQAALLRLADGDYKEAVFLFSQVYEYADSADKQLEAMYGYVTEHNHFSDETTMEYVGMLAEAAYEDSADLKAALEAAAEAEAEGAEVPAES